MVYNLHERQLSVSPQAAGRLIDTLATPLDELWPCDRWPPMRFDKALGVGARGGHGPIRYRVEVYAPGQFVRFRFEAPSGFDGYHEYVLVPRSSVEAVLRHSCVMRTTGLARLSWPLVYRPMHDALIEDSLDRASRSLGLSVAEPQGWSRRVRCLRAVARSVLARRARGTDNGTDRGSAVPAIGQRSTDRSGPAGPMC